MVNDQIFGVRASTNLNLTHPPPRGGGIDGRLDRLKVDGGRDPMTVDKKVGCHAQSWC
jgi:hypothetical protein